MNVRARAIHEPCVLHRSAEPAGWLASARVMDPEKCLRVLVQLLHVQSADHRRGHDDVRAQEQSMSPHGAAGRPV